MSDSIAPLPGPRRKRHRGIKLSPLERAILEVLAEKWDSYIGGAYCMGFMGIRDELYDHEKDRLLDPLPRCRNQIRTACRRMRKFGLTQFQQGLWTEDGEMAGAGYGITKAGLDYLERDNERQAASQAGDRKETSVQPAQPVPEDQSDRAS